MRSLLWDCLIICNLYNKYIIVYIYKQSPVKWELYWKYVVLPDRLSLVTTVVITISVCCVFSVIFDGNVDPRQWRVLLWLSRVLWHCTQWGDLVLGPAHSSAQSEHLLICTLTIKTKQTLDRYNILDGMVTANRCNSHTVQ